MRKLEEETSLSGEAMLVHSAEELSAFASKHGAYNHFEAASKGLHDILGHFKLLLHADVSIVVHVIERAQSVWDKHTFTLFQIK